ncbi:hypothetical protein [Pseudomonas sp. Sample_22]|uniref:hypothetical protein n=1 Tax=Pseudomonas sp. Sample_22 TaxID=2448266 RepID=UPI001032CFAE|nr:hypothetical protein [Pseudomonas sp. Sample_22]
MTFNHRIPVTNSVDMAMQIVAALIAAGLLPNDGEIMTETQRKIASILREHLPVATPYCECH